MLSGKAAALSILIMDTNGLILFHILLTAEGLSFAGTGSVSMLLLSFFLPIPAFMQFLVVLLFAFFALPIEQLF